MNQLITLNTQAHTSRVLGSWLAGRDGGAMRAGIQAAGENQVQTDLTAEQLLDVLGAHNTSTAGVAVTPDSAMRVSAVYGCVSRIAGAIKTLPLAVFERLEDAPQRVMHDYYWMFNERANDDMSAADAWEYLVSSKLFYGDGFAELLRPGIASNRVIGWKPHHPLRVQPFRDARTKVKYFRVQPEIGEAYVLDSADMVQLTSLGYDGLTSPSPITYAAMESIGTAIAGQRHAGKFFREGATFDYALKTAGKLDDKQTKVLIASILARNSNSRSPLILSGGLEPAQISVNSKDAEILATRLFTVEEICRIFGVPPHLVGHTEKNSSWGSGMEEQGENFVRYTLGGHLIQIKQEFNHRLWPSRSRYFVEHVLDALTRGNLKTRYEAYRIALGRSGERPWLDENEIRRIENLAPKTFAINPGKPDPTTGADANA